MPQNKNFEQKLSSMTQLRVPLDVEPVEKSTVNDGWPIVTTEGSQRGDTWKNPTTIENEPRPASLWWKCQRDWRVPWRGRRLRFYLEPICEPSSCVTPYAKSCSRSYCGTIGCKPRYCCKVGKGLTYPKCHTHWRERFQPNGAFPRLIWNFCLWRRFLLPLSWGQFYPGKWPSMTMACPAKRLCQHSCSKIWKEGGESHHKLRSRSRNPNRHCCARWEVHIVSGMEK